MPKAVIFMPYDPKANLYEQIRIEYGGGEMHKNKKVKEFLVSKGYAVHEVWFDGKKQSHLASMDTGHVYIRGHGMPGEGVIKGLKGGGETVEYKTVYERLVSSGLSKSYSGEVHCYNCHSAEHNKEAGPFFGDPYAQRFANYMYTKGYKSCSYFGYLGPLDSFPKPGSQGETIYSREKVFVGTKMELKELGTWDQARVRIHPTVNKISLGQRVGAFFGR